MELAPIKEFYDHLVPRQLSAGVNERHHKILELLVGTGLRDGMRVLEVGCGIGTVTGLIAAKIPRGHLTALDLSSTSVAQARQKLGHLGHVDLLVADAVTGSLSGHYDRIVLPDVLEHIPADRHAALFTRLRDLMSPGAMILVHSPDPYYADWLKANHPELLQVVDLSLHLAYLIPLLDKAGLALVDLQRHSIWTDRPDYMALTLERMETSPAFHLRSRPERSILQRIKDKFL
jgi:protein-L-isoaspartate O-methyltransferase